MSFRTVVISNTCKLDYKLNYLTIRTNEDIKQVFIEEIAVLILETTAISITAALLSELIKQKVKVIFCDEKRNPSSELISYYGSHDTSNKILSQINWDTIIKEEVWTIIIKEKIKNQALLLKELNLSQHELLFSYIDQLEHYDSTNREGHAAKVYFNAIFGNEFTRNDDCATNAALNYGYTLLLSTFNREIVSQGYITQLGLFHKNRFNQFNFASDLIEPFRVIVDKFVIRNNFSKFEKDEKHIMVTILNQEVKIDGKKQYLLNAIKIYCKSVFNILNKLDNDFICFEYEL
ncbi:MAG: type II CRISPR-associated endonuclease Cas1 [bacterium]